MPFYLLDRFRKAARQIGHTISHGFPIYPWYFNYDKKDLIDHAFRTATPSPRAFADLGGVWGVNGAYTFYALERHAISRGYLVDTNFTPAVTARQAAHPQLSLVNGNFGDPAVAARIGAVDAVMLFDVLLHQVSPDWDEILKMYADATRCFIIFNQQWVGSPETVRLLDLGEEEYFRNVPRRRNDPAYRDVYVKMYEIHPEHGRIWRDIHNVWQWGITDAALITALDGLGFEMLHWRDCGQFGYLKNFRNRAFVFGKR